MVLGALVDRGAGVAAVARAGLVVVVPIEVRGVRVPSVALGDGVPAASAEAGLVEGEGDGGGLVVLGPSPQDGQGDGPGAGGA